MSDVPGQAVALFSQKISSIIVCGHSPVIDLSSQLRDRFTVSEKGDTL